MFALDQNLGITLETKLRLYNTRILPIFLYGSEICYLTSTLEKKIDVLDNWCLRRILHIHWTDFVSNDVVRSCTVRDNRSLLRYFGSYPAMGSARYRWGAWRYKQQEMSTGLEVVE